MNDEQKIVLDPLALQQEWARRDVEAFARTIDPAIDVSAFHETYYGLLSRFARGEIRRLVVSVPPQHGKSHGASYLLPAYMLGKDPDLKMAIASYSFSLARRFGAGVQRLIEEPVYRKIFPETRLKGMGASKSEEVGASRTADRIDVVGRAGSLRLVGREGSLTGNRVDVMIVDDLYKDAMEAHSPLVRQNTWEWYCSVVRTRMHNDSRELIVSTRWHREDLIGRLLQTEPDRWTVVNFPAIQNADPTELDPRNRGEALWPARHSTQLLEERRRLDSMLFEALYQGDPSAPEGLLYGDRFARYVAIEEPVARRGAYVDPADVGSDALCALCYSVGAVSGKLYVTDALLTEAPMEQTEGLVVEMLRRNDTQSVWVESNNGGRGFARALARSVRCRVDPFAQKGNKEARLLSGSADVLRSVVVPIDWEARWPEFYRALVDFRRSVRANAHDDAPDALTGAVEREVAANERGAKITAVAFR